MINRFDVEKYLGEDWKKFRNGETWDDVGLFKELLDKENKFLDFEKWCFDNWVDKFINIEDTDNQSFTSWFFTPIRFCKLAIKFLEKEKNNEQDTTS